MRLEPGLAVNLRTGERRDVSQLSNIVAMAGIGHPPRFFCHAGSMRCQRAKKSIALADHQSLTYSDVSAFADAGQTLVMTEKDAVKCRAFADENWWYLPVDAHLSGDRPDMLLDSLISLTR